MQNALKVYTFDRQSATKLHPNRDENRVILFTKLAQGDVPANASAEPQLHP